MDQPQRSGASDTLEGLRSGLSAGNVVVFLISDPDPSTRNQVIITDRGSKEFPGGPCTMQPQGPGPFGTPEASSAHMMACAGVVFCPKTLAVNPNPNP